MSMVVSEKLRRALVDQSTDVDGRVREVKDMLSEMGVFGGMMEG